MHTPIVLQYQWLRSVLRGHFAYSGLPSNSPPGLTPSSQRRVVFGIGLSTAEGMAQVGLLRPLLERFSLPTRNFTPSPAGGCLMTWANVRKAERGTAACSDL